MGEGISIRRLDALPPSFSGLLSEGEAAGYRFLRRVLDEWESGTYRFSRPGEALFGAESDGRLVGVCGLGVDPYQADDRVGRVRNVYVLSEFRGRGIGRELVSAAIASAEGRFDRLRLRAEEPGPARLYESLGFEARPGVPNSTHVMELPKGGPIVTDPSLAEMIDDLERGHDGDPWHGPPLLKVLGGVTAEVASAKPVPGGHSIWEIVAHLAAWDEVVARRIESGVAIEEPEGGNFPPVAESGPDAWREALDLLDRNHARLLRVVSALDARSKDAPVAGKGYTVAHMVRGVAQHMAYHAGQIAVLASFQPDRGS